MSNSRKAPKVLIFLIDFFVICLVISLAQSYAQAPTGTPFEIARINGPVTLDGISDEPAWEGVEPLPLVQRTPNFGDAPTEKTDIIIAYDDDYIYVAGSMYESDHDKIADISLKRDIWSYSCDFIFILLDTFNDNENAVLFGVSPTGTRTDVSIMNDAKDAPARNINTHWNTFWDTEAVINENGWFVEMRIPFSSLRFQEDANGRVVMGLIADRWRAKEYEMDIFPPVPKDLGPWAVLRPSQGAKIVFEGIKSHNPLYVTPYVLGGFGQKNELDETETEYVSDKSLQHEAGLDIKYGLTNNLTLDVTVNTDFAQVEADDQQINLTRYSLFFPEKRLFFQERSGNFDFSFDESNRLFHSRKIGIHDKNQVRIFGGARVVGKKRTMGCWIPEHAD